MVSNATLPKTPVSSTTPPPVSGPEFGVATLTCVHCAAVSAAQQIIAAAATANGTGHTAQLNAIDLEFRGKNVMLVDDSVVRGTTSQQIIQMARDAGARNVFFASASPPVRYPNVYGIDMPAASELVAHGRTEAEVCEWIGADGLIYQDLDDLIDACREGNPSIHRFDTSCFSGEYVTGVEPGYLERLQAQRSDQAKSARRNAPPILAAG